MNSKSISSLSVFLLGILLCSTSPIKAADVTVNVNASSYIRSIPETMYGTNTQCWDGAQNGGNENFNNLMAASEMPPAQENSDAVLFDPVTGLYGDGTSS